MAGRPWQPMDQSSTNPETPEIVRILLQRRQQRVDINDVEHARSRAALYQTRDQFKRRKFDTVQNDNDNDNDTLREVPHRSNEGLASQARVSGPWSHKKESVLLGKLAPWQGVQIRTVVDRV